MNKLNHNIDLYFPNKIVSTFYAAILKPRKKFYFKNVIQPFLCKYPKTDSLGWVFSLRNCQS